MNPKTYSLAQAARDYAAVEKLLSGPASQLEKPFSPLIDLVFQRWGGTNASDFFKSINKASAQTVLGRKQPANAGIHDLELDIRCEITKRGTNPSGTIRFGTHPTPFGPALVAISEYGICGLRFGEELAELAAQWPGAEFKEDQKAVAELCKRIFGGTNEAIPVHLRGTEFQISVWLTLLALPMGCLSSYQEVARQIGKPEATRAVASAIARNGIGYLVPCHRIIQSLGASGEYRWGALRKQAMIGWEAAKVRPVRAR